MEQGLPSPSDNARMRLLHAAIRVFSKRQFDEVGIREIASIAGINSSQIFFYFKDKEGLYIEALKLSSRIALRLIKLLPELPKSDENDSIPRAKFAIWTNIRMFVGFGIFSKTNPNPGKLPELEYLALMFLLHEIRNPKKSSETILIEVVNPYVNYLSNCVQILRPDLDNDSILKMGISIYGQLLFFICHQELLCLVNGENYNNSIEDFTEHFANFIINGIDVDKYGARN